MSYYEALGAAVAREADASLQAWINTPNPAHTVKAPGRSLRAAFDWRAWGTWTADEPEAGKYLLIAGPFTVTFA